MTDEEIKAVVTRYIISGHESDNADCLHEMDEWQTGEESELDDLSKAYNFYRSAKVTVTWDEPRGDSPGSQAAGEPGLHDSSGEYPSIETCPDDPGDGPGMTLPYEVIDYPVIVFGADGARVQKLSEYYAEKGL